MTDVPERLSGRCMCGEVTYTTSAPPVTPVLICHCVDCQRQTGSAYTTVVGVPAASLTVTGESLSSYATTGEDHGQPTVRSYCAGCGSPIVTHGAYPGMAFIKVGTLDDPSWATPVVEIWRGSAPPWTPEFPGTTVFERDPTGM